MEYILHVLNKVITVTLFNSSGGAVLVLEPVSKGHTTDRSYNFTSTEYGTAAVGIVPFKGSGWSRHEHKR